jgi:hypothetical protein
VHSYLRAQAQSPLRFITIVGSSSSSVGITTRIIPRHGIPTLAWMHISAFV